ncbi:MAG: AIR synthase related protein [Desulfobacter sp.]
MGYKGRDVEVVMLENGHCLVGACDSCGAVGEKDLDQVSAPARLVGRFTARVALMEVIAVGARPRIMTVGIASEPDPTGSEILSGVRKELEWAGFPDLALAVSTEKNFTPGQTGLGIGVTGTCMETDLRLAGSQPGDNVYVLGLPLVGDEVAMAPESAILSAAHILSLLNTPGIHDVVPVGSRGILAEARDLAIHTGTFFIPATNSIPDLLKPGGPSTCAVFTTEPSYSPATESDALMQGLPLLPIGRLALSKN